MSKLNKAEKVLKFLENIYKSAETSQGMTSLCKEYGISPTFAVCAKRERLIKKEGKVTKYICKTPPSIYTAETLVNRVKKYNNTAKKRELIKSKIESQGKGKLSNHDNLHARWGMLQSVPEDLNEFIGDQTGDINIFSQDGVLTQDDVKVEVVYVGKSSKIASWVKNLFKS